MATYCYQCWFHTLNKIIPLVIETCTQKRKNYTTELRFILKLLIALSHLLCVVNNTNQMIHLLNNLRIKEITLHWLLIVHFHKKYASSVTFLNFTSLPSEEIVFHLSSTYLDVIIVDLFLVVGTIIVKEIISTALLLLVFL